MSRGAVQLDRSFHLPFRRALETMPEIESGPGTDWRRRLDELQASALGQLEHATDAAALDQWRITHLGRKSALSDLLGGLGKLAPDERREVGSAANDVKRSLEQAFAGRDD